MEFFWPFLGFAACGLIGIFWKCAFSCAMELKFVKDRAWLTEAVMVFAAVALGGLRISFLGVDCRKQCEKLLV